MKKLLLVLAMVLCCSTASALTVKVVFDASTDPTDRTVVLVSETSGDYTEVFGQISEPGATFVLIDNIVDKKPYYYVAYRWKTSGEVSLYSAEFPYTTEAPTELPVVHKLPPIKLPGVILNLVINIEEIPTP